MMLVTRHSRRRLGSKSRIYFFGRATDAVALQLGSGWTFLAGGTLTRPRRTQYELFRQTFFNCLIDKIGIRRVHTEAREMPPY
jgi:hypothetical protein